MTHTRGYTTTKQATHDTPKTNQATIIPTVMTSGITQTGVVAVRASLTVVLLMVTDGVIVGTQVQEVLRRTRPSF
jgi:hypothetical protein